MSRIHAALRVRRTDYRPPSAGNPPPLERTARPGAAAWQKPFQTVEEHERIVATYSLPLLRAIAADLGKRDWLDQWSEMRLTAVRKRIREISPT